MKKWKILIFLGIVFFSHAAMAFQECTADRERFCKKLRKDQNNFIECLEDHRSKLSQDCRDRVDLHEAREEMYEECRGDRERYCSQYSMRDPGYKECIRKNERKFSRDCREEIQEVKRLKGEIQRRHGRSY